MSPMNSCTTNSILRETIFSDPKEVWKCFDHRWMRCDNS
jgi:hypothetical protein